MLQVIAMKETFIMATFMDKENLYIVMAAITRFLSHRFQLIGIGRIYQARNQQGDRSHISCSRWKKEWSWCKSMAKWKSVVFSLNVELYPFRYEGEWLNDVIHGKGVLQKVEGGKYRGEFWNGVRTGVGSEVSSS